MSKKQKIYFVCANCGQDYLKWQGQCSNCKEWNTLKEFKMTDSVLSRTMAGGISRKPTSVTKIKEQERPGFSSGIGEFDRVLGGKIVKGSVTLIAADPGKGKSTLLTQVAGKVARNEGIVLYCSGEENEVQIRDRAQRLNALSENFFVFNTENIEEIVSAVQELKPVLLVVDSIQHIKNPEIEGIEGSIRQVESCSKILVNMAKTTGVAIFIVGHVTKDENIAGPKRLEHVVDTVLYLEGDATNDLRLLRSTKNRMGPTTEIGVFRMENEGMIEVSNPSDYLISHRNHGESGSAVTCTNGKRPMLVEVQALVSSTAYENAVPRRTSRGFERDKLNILIAVLEKKCGIRLGAKDIYLNIAGGLKINEPAADLGAALAIVSSEQDTPIPPKTCIVGEVGLTGEVRPIKNIEVLVKEAEKNGFIRFVLPEQNFERANQTAQKIELFPVKKVKEAISLLFGSRIKKSTR